MIPTADKRAAFRRLHQSGCFLLPNPWDVGGARLLAGMGFKALASTSAGAAWSMGRPDGGAGLDDILDHLRVLAAATDLPLNADFENGFADAPGAVAAHVAMAVETGVSGLSIEDATGRPDEPIYGFDLAVARVAAARAAIDQGGSGVLLTARAESFLRTKGDLADVVARLKATPGARVVSTASAAHLSAKLDFEDLQATGEYSGFGAYGRSKLANILFTRALARRLVGSGVTANCLHPGFVATRFGDASGGMVQVLTALAKRLFAITPEEGAKTIIHLASSPEVEGVSGQYFYRCKVTTPSIAAQDDASAERLWAVSEELAG